MACDGAVALWLRRAHKGLHFAARSVSKRIAFPAFGAHSEFSPTGGDVSGPSGEAAFFQPATGGST